MIDNFCAFILTHGRPDRVHTYKALKVGGYTGRIVLVVDNEDEAEEEYKKIYGDDVYVFDKRAVSDTFDEGDNFEDRRTIVYARNACFEIAREIGVEYFIQLDDDYTDFRYFFNDAHQFIRSHWVFIKQIDRVLKAMLRYYEENPVILTIAMSQTGDFIGGAMGSRAQKKVALRKCMNTMICSVNRPFQFVGRVNEDVNTYVSRGARGDLLLSVLSVGVNQLDTQTNRGGMTEMYMDSGTYVKSFYSVIYAPSCVDIMVMGVTHRRLHHRVAWAHAVPCIIDERYKKNGRKAVEEQ